jgi:hypothetical protein
MTLRFSTIPLLLLALTLSAQPQSDTPKPAPELKKLDYFVGTWHAEGELKPGPFGPGGKFSSTNRVQWMDGAFFLVTQSDFHGATGSGSETAYMGYDTDNKIYTYDSFNTLGEADHAKGNLDGNTWIWLSDTQIGTQTMKGRMTLNILSPTTYHFKFEISPDAATWTTVIEGQDTKQ